MAENNMHLQHPPLVAGYPLPPVPVTPFAAVPITHPAPAVEAAPLPTVTAAPPQVTDTLAPGIPSAPVTPESQAGAAKVPPTNDELVDLYVRLRDEADVIKGRHQEELRTHNELMNKISGELDSRMAKTGSKSIGTDSGTASRIITQTAVCNDWGAFEAWFWAERRLDLFPRKLNIAPFTQMLDEGQPLPPGVRLEQSARVQVRRKTKK